MHWEDRGGAATRGFVSLFVPGCKEGWRGQEETSAMRIKTQRDFLAVEECLEGTFVKSTEHADTGQLAISGRRQPEMKTHLQWPLVVPSRLEDAARDAPVLLLAHTSVFVIVVVIVLPIVGHRGSTHHKE
jgi:hypothetical protein